VDGWGVGKSNALVFAYLFEPGNGVRSIGVAATTLVRTAMGVGA
jgi:hypothetical protein